MNNIISMSNAKILRSCRHVKEISVKWAIVKAMRDFNNNCVVDKPYEGWELKEERMAYIKKVNELREKNNGLS